MYIPRYLEPFLRRRLKDRMIFVGGPRQVGKTQISLFLAGVSTQEQKRPECYMNWDTPGVSRLLKEGVLPAGPLIILDEIHKYPRWRNLLKGLFDQYRGQKNFMVTGSAKLDYYRRGGDSLMGRYFHFRLHPFSLLEWNKEPSQKDLERLLQFGGFPEPLLSGDPSLHRLWQNQRMLQVVREDLRDLENVRDISKLESLVEELPSRIGSPLSINSLREDLEIDHKTAQRWLLILEALYVFFRIPPLGSTKFKAVKKEQKAYMWDWSMVEDPGARFENLVASQLLKYCHLQEDVEGHKMELRYIRDTNGREIDFVVLKDKKPEFAVEAKLQPSLSSTHLEFFRDRSSIPKFYHVYHEGKSFDAKGILCRNFLDFCLETKMP